MYVINDLYDDWTEDVAFQIVKDGEVLSSQLQPVQVVSLGREIIESDISLPDQPGNYMMIASYEREKETVRSLRDFEIVIKP